MDFSLRFVKPLSSAELAYLVQEDERVDPNHVIALLRFTNIDEALQAHVRAYIAVR